jgi:hypothetical protein
MMERIKDELGAGDVSAARLANLYPVASVYPSIIGTLFSEIKRQRRRTAYLASRLSS